MSTRTNIIIKSRKGFKQLYHHCDGYPEGVGKELQKSLHDMLVEKIDMNNINTISDYLESKDIEYEIEDYEFPNPHGDIEYLYIVDIDNKITTCYGITSYIVKSNTVHNKSKDCYADMNKVIAGTIKESEYCRIVYSAGFNDSWQSIEERLK